MGSKPAKPLPDAVGFWPDAPKPLRSNGGSTQALRFGEHFGYNADTGEYGDLMKMSVIDPAKVTRVALQERRFGRFVDAYHGSARCRNQGRRKEDCGRRRWPWNVLAAFPENGVGALRSKGAPTTPAM